MTLPDSGARQEFETGAVRDISKGKGRCDLLPLDIIDMLIFDYTCWNSSMRIEARDVVPTVFGCIDLYITSLGMDGVHLTNAICRFINDTFDHDIYGAIIELSKHYEDGAKKYEPNNWKLGINIHCYIDSAIRHYLKHLRGDTDEPHHRAVLWNLVGALWTLKHHPELNDICN